MPHERISDAAEVGTTSKTSDYHIRILACHLHLLLGLKADNGLVETYMIEDRTKGIFTIRSGHCQLDSLGNRTSKGSVVIGIAGDYIFSGTGGHGRRRGNRRTEGLHYRSAIRLLVVTDFHHIDGTFKAELLSRI